MRPVRRRLRISATEREFVESVRRVLLDAGWRESGGSDPEFSRTVGRTTFRGALSRFVVLARREGLPALERLLSRQNRELRRDSERNRFRERRLAGELRREVGRRVELGLPGRLAGIEEDE